MRKDYLAPKIKTLFYQPILMGDTASKLTGDVFDDSGNGVGTIGWGGESDEDDIPDAKPINVWDW